MGKSKSNTRTTLALLSTAFVVIGTYNSVVINSDEFMDHRQVRYVKRLDEVYGVVKPGREMANYGRWTKLASAPKKFISAVSAPVVQQQVQAQPETVVEEVIANNAAIKEELNLELKEVFNAKKYPTPPKPEEFVGSLRANDGEIESISFKLPGMSETFDIPSTAMTGNVFQYPGEEGELSGMIYQMDKSSYMVTLTNGPLEGTRLKFSALQEEDIGNNSAAVAENNYASETESAQTEETPPAFEPVVSDNGETAAVGQFGAQQPAQQSEEAAPSPTFAQAAENLENGDSFDQQAQQAAGLEQAANGGQGFNFNEQPATL